MTEATAAKVPPHLRKYVIDQNYDRYTPEDQATWRFIMRQLREYLGVFAHPGYLEGLQKTGISVERIPRITELDEKLNEYGWGAVPVSGFIPPAAFMEFQSIGVLPVASDMRTLEHWLYTPAPDIVHEAAGHAPLLIHADYSDYLRRYGEIARHAIISRDDLDQYEAIRTLSDLKERPDSSPGDIAAAERRLREVEGATTKISEATLLSRMNWWTVEYGLIGKLEDPRLYGAGLLSSVGEARTCLLDDVEKLPLTVDCIAHAYDITEPQPRLFVTPNFETLTVVLDQLAERLSYRRGGKFGLDEAILARTVNTVVLDTGLQISGRVSSYLTDDAGEPSYLVFKGPSQLSFDYEQLNGHGPSRHAEGFSCPLGRVKGPKAVVSDFSRADVAKLDRLDFVSGVVVTGEIKHAEFKDGRLLWLTWTNCRVTRGPDVLFDPSWGEYDMPAGWKVTSVFGGPADRAGYGDTEAFMNRGSNPRVITDDERERFALYKEIRDLRERNHGHFDKLVQRYLERPGDDWLIGLELQELAARKRAHIPALVEKLNPEARADSTTKLALQLGAQLIDR